MVPLPPLFPLPQRSSARSTGSGRRGRTTSSGTCARTHTRRVSVADIGADDEEHGTFGWEDVKFLEGWEEERVIETVVES